MTRLAPAWGLLLALCLAGAAQAADRLRIVAQKTGTFGWELDVIRTHKLDVAAGIDLQLVELASPESGKIALKGGSADLIVADVMWVARERALGGSMAFHPYTSTLGAVMVPAASKVRAISDLAGLRLGVAGGALDKSWLLLQALGRRGGFDIRRSATILYGAPQLLSVKASQGDIDAVLNYWNLSADLEAQGFRRAIEMADVQRQLGAREPIAMVGYAFDEAFAAKNGPLLRRFFAMTNEAKEILAKSPDEWTRLADRIGGTHDPHVLDIYRARYAAGIPRRSLADEESDARVLYRVLAETGGSDLVGPAENLPAGTYWFAGAGH